MTRRRTLIKLFSELLGDDFYYYDADDIINQLKPESESVYIHFRFKHVVAMSEPQKKLFELKLTQLQKIFLEYEITGGRVMWFGYMITINLTTIEELENLMFNTKLEYEHRIKRMKEQMKVLKEQMVKITT